MKDHAPIKLPAAVHAAITKVQAAEAELEQRKVKVAKLQADKSAAEAQLAAARERNADLLADRILDGIAVTGVNLERKAGGEDTNQLHVVGLTRAITKAERAVEAARPSIEEARRELMSTVVKWISNAQAPLLERLRNHLAELAPDLANLAALDEVRSTLIGDRFTLPSGITPPLAGAATVNSFLDGIPRPLQSDGLTSKSVRSTAQKTAAAITSNQQCV